MINAIDLPPRRPHSPDPRDCCGEGCVRCIHDIHEEAMERYQRELVAWILTHPGSDPLSGDVRAREGKPR